jgi:hypothetical protein
LLGTLLVILLLSGVGPVAGFREDEVQCEEAHAHLLECCDEFRSNLQCYFHDPGCDPPTYPDLDVAESRHVQSLSCSEIRASDYCSVEYEDQACGDCW